MNCKAFLATASIGVAFSLFASVPVPEVSVVDMFQNSKGIVTITYNLSSASAVVTLDIQTNATAETWASIGGEAVCNAQGDVWKVVGTGPRAISWDAATCWSGNKIPVNGVRAVVTAWALDNTPDYMVVDISAAAQPNTQTYYPAADFVPGGVTNDIYKTSTLLMRKIMAKGVKWTMGSTTLESSKRNAAREETHLVTLTNNYYIGVYEVTQYQWSQVATNSSTSAKFTTERFMRPMESVCYNEIRNTVNATAANASYNWPEDPNPSSFLGLLRSKSGIDFDLPSEAQWEFAARSGNGSGYWNDGSAILSDPWIDANLKLLGRYTYNGGKVGSSYAEPAADCDVTNGTAIVGSYAPNDWGIYDMHGNVWEWCLDWLADDISACDGKVNIDPANPANPLSGASTVNRVRRGGGYNSPSNENRPALRGEYEATWRNSCVGFRVACQAGLQ